MNTTNRSTTNSASTTTKKDDKKDDPNEKNHNHHSPQDPPKMSSSSSSLIHPPIRVLCLHDANSNASQLYDILQPLDERLYNRHRIEFVYIDSPLCCSQEEQQSQSQQSQPQRGQEVVDHVQKRIWWEESRGEYHSLQHHVLNEEQPDLQEQGTHSHSNDDEMDNDDDDDDGRSDENHKNDHGAPSGRSSLTPPPCSSSSSRNSHARVGLDASLVHIRQVWNTMPFHGILAVGQGCAVASLLPFLMNGSSSSSTRGLPNFAIFIHGQSLLEEDESLMEEEDELNFKCLHIINEKNPLSQRLVTQLRGEVHVSLDKTMTKQDFNVIGKFLVQEKKRLRGSEGGYQKLALQSELHRVEQEASRIVAEQIRENPPKALMAVITPQSIGGWSGPKRRGPHDEGGGAPCPSEFLMNKEDRKNTTPGGGGGGGGGRIDDGPSRQHPNSAGNPNLR